MITKEQAIENVKKYISKKNREYIEVVSDRVNFEEQKYINYGKFEEQKKDIFTVTCKLEGYTDPILHFITVDAETGEILFTTTPHGYAEEWEE
ncbi:hypothetical protein [Flavobacterium humi]|uniref:PepSY domain-containing protein n=1 Tax=Flavobacterium humi TaxID=2562683 RepID=A0A4Z0LAT6_9FLAO|nr:hypothetical protein [Flavobacterium humi]TGD58597.1 hypothetical protein E4635_06700 [Flavobacterium humi]